MLSDAQIRAMAEEIVEPARADAGGGGWWWRHKWGLHRSGVEAAREHEMQRIESIIRRHLAACEPADDARLREAVGLLREARDEIESWAAYASDYFQEKHDLKGCLAKFDAFLARIDVSQSPPNRDTTGGHVTRSDASGPLCPPTPGRL